MEVIDLGQGKKMVISESSGQTVVCLIDRDDAVVIGRGVDRQAAVTDAVAAMEAVEAALQMPAPGFERCACGRGYVIGGGKCHYCHLYATS